MSTKDKLSSAAQFLSEVMSDESERLTLPMIQLFNEARRDIELASRYLGVDEK